jgi:hypothetical protein
MMVLGTTLVTVCALQVGIATPALAATYPGDLQASSWHGCSTGDTRLGSTASLTRLAYDSGGELDSSTYVGWVEWRYNSTSSCPGYQFLAVHLRGATAHSLFKDDWAFVHNERTSDSADLWSLWAPSSGNWANITQLSSSKDSLGRVIYNYETDLLWSANSTVCVAEVGTPDPYVSYDLSGSGAFCA